MALASSFIFYFLLSLHLTGICVQGSTIKVDYGEDKNVSIKFTEKESIIVPITLYNFTGSYDANGKVIFHFRSADEDIFLVENVTGIEITGGEGEDAFPVTFHLQLKGVSIGIASIKIDQIDSTTQAEVEVSEHVVKVLKNDSILDVLFLYLVLAWLELSYFTMGIKIEPKVVAKKFKPPTAPIIGMLCQFGVMPALAFAITKLIKLDDQTALGLIFVGTCPGGYLSNLFSLLLDCDFVLSLAMTATSTILCLGFMPLNLFIYASPLIAENESLQTPYFDLFLQLVLLIAPVLIGMLLGYFFPKLRDYSEKLLKPIATVCILVSLGFGIPANLYIYTSPWQAWVVSLLLPFCGCLIGFIIAKVTCLKKAQAITVALETGAQNSLLANTVLDLFYPRPEADLVGRIPLLIGMLSLTEGCIAVFIFLIKKRVCPSDDDDGDDVKDIDFIHAVENGTINKGFDNTGDIPMVDGNGNFGKSSLKTFKAKPTADMGPSETDANNSAKMTKL